MCRVSDISIFLHHFILTILVTSSISVKVQKASFILTEIGKKKKQDTKQNSEQNSVSTV